MAYHWWDSFDGYVAADFNKVYAQITGSGHALGTGRFGTSGFVMPGGNQCQLKVPISGTPATVGFSASLRQTTNTVNLRFGSFADGGTVQVSFQLTALGKISVSRGNGTALLATGTINIPAATDFHFECKVTIHGTTGQVTTKINGVVDINTAANLNTQATANAYATDFYFGPDTNFGVGGAYTVTADDLVVWDTSGSAPYNTYPGDCRVQCLTPTGDGGHTQWALSTGSSHFAVVDEAAQNGDTDYAHDATVGDRETYTFSDLASTAANVLGVALVAVAKKDDAGAKSIETTIRSGGVDYDTGVAHALGTGYEYHRDQLTQNPATGPAAWALADVDALEAGVKVNA